MKTRNVKKIAILNPYLQGGHLETAEIESARRFTLAAEKIGIEVRVLASSDDIRGFDPDFVITITYQEPKLTSYPTYGLVTMPVTWVRDIPRFVRNILSYDGYITPVTSVIDWLKALGKLNNKIIYIANAAFSIPKTEFFSCNFTQATPVYIGTNWDKSRHSGLFKLLTESSDQSTYLRCFGPKKNWVQYSEKLYGGEIAFDGFSAINVYQNNGIGLCINHPDFDREGVPSSRTFEIAASSAIAICSHNEYTESIFGDSVLYVDHKVSTDELGYQIIEAVEYIRNNPEASANMAREAHDIFIKNISMEIFLDRILDMHSTILTANDYLRNKHNIPKEKVLFIIKVDDNNYHHLEETINTIQQQTYNLIDWVINCSTTLQENIAKKLNLTAQQFINHHESHTEDLLPYLFQTEASWLGIIQAGDKLFKQHVSSLLKIANTSAAFRNNLVAIQSGCLAESKDFFLSDDVKDDHFIKNDARAKIHYLPQSTSKSDFLQLRSCLFQIKNINFSILQELHLNEPTETINKKALSSFGFIQEIADLTTSFYFSIPEVEIKEESA